MAPECLPRPLCRPAMAFSEGNKFLHVTILPLPRPHKSNCSGDGKVRHRHLFHARDLKTAGHECQAAATRANALSSLSVRYTTFARTPRGASAFVTSNM